MPTNNTAVTRPIVINWHVTEACNYRCHYCYTKWQQPDRQELIRDPASTTALLREIFRHFYRPTAPLPPRLNFAGGEPLLHAARVLRAMEVARSIGFDVSIISNGSRLDTSLTTAMAPLLSTLGLCLDALTPSVNTEIGREDHRGVQLRTDVLADMVSLARRINPSLALKINTVVTGANWQEDMNAMIAALAPQRWKVLRMLPIVTHDLAVTSEQFNAFVERHRGLAAPMCVEDNDDMVGSYVMVDPHGRFFQNRSRGHGYDYSPPILSIGADAAFSHISWSPSKFASRYSSIRIEASA